MKRFLLVLISALLFGYANSNAQPKAVDLGLSVKWASFNLGATSEEGSGDFYAWGETKPKSTYKWGNNKYCGLDGEDIIVYKYNNTDGKTRLDLSDDAARAKLRGKWRIPTDTEWIELHERCEWHWTSLEGVNGYVVTGPNGNSIFLPAAGFHDIYYGDQAHAVGLTGRYLSSIRRIDDPCRIWILNFNRDERICGDKNYPYVLLRYIGFSVRPVTD